MRTTVAVLLATLIIPTGASAALPLYTALPVPLPDLPPANQSITSPLGLSDNGVVLFANHQQRIENSIFTSLHSYSLANALTNTVVELFPLSNTYLLPTPIAFTSANTLVFTGTALLSYSDGQFTPIPSPPLNNTILDVRSVNRRNHMVGEYYSPADFIDAPELFATPVLVRNGVTTLLGPTVQNTDENYAYVFANRVLPLSINDTDQIVGVSYTAQGLARPFLWQADVMTQLPAPEGIDTYAERITSSGQIFGTVALRDPNIRACAWDEGIFSLLPIPDGYNASVLQTANDRGDFLLYVYNTLDPSVPFLQLLSLDGVYYDTADILRNVTAPDTKVEFLNNNRQLLVPNADGTGYLLLTPIPEPNLSLPLLALASLIAKRPQRR